MPTSFAIGTLAQLLDRSQEWYLPGLNNAIYTGRGPLVLLFYDGFELKAMEGIAGAAYSRARWAARFIVRNVRRAQVWTGFYTAFRGLCTCLRQVGCDVRVNNFTLARRHPRYPIGLVGYPSGLTQVRLPNPTLLGPGDFGFPDATASLAREARFRRMIQACPWSADLYRPHWGEKMFVWPVGIDTNAWPDLSAVPKSIDVLLYDKIRWDRDRVLPRVRWRVEEHLKRRGLSCRVVEYGKHHLSTYAHLLRQSRVMIFLCEHEAQGLACQEAMSCNVPVLAWDEGVLVDPQQQRFAGPELVVTSIPYFDRRCGERFKLNEFEDVFSEFWSKRDDYRPRQYVLEHLSYTGAAQSYLEAYSILM